MSKMMDYFRKKTTLHKNKVIKNIALAIKNLKKRGLKHDVSTLQSPELTSCSPLIYYQDNKIELTEKQTKQYKNLFIEGRKFHFFVNDHHVEYYEHSNDPISEFDLMSLIEMCCDWIAKNPNYPLAELENLKKTFKVSKQVEFILKNTIENLMDKPTTKLKIKI